MGHEPPYPSAIFSGPRRDPDRGHRRRDGRGHAADHRFGGPARAADRRGARGCRPRHPGDRDRTGLGGELHRSFEGHRPSLTSDFLPHPCPIEAQNGAPEPKSRGIIIRVSGVRVPPPASHGPLFRLYRAKAGHCGAFRGSAAVNSAAQSIQAFRVAGPDPRFPLGGTTFCQTEEEDSLLAVAASCTRFVRSHCWAVQRLNGAPRHLPPPVPPLRRAANTLRTGEVFDWL